MEPDNQSSNDENQAHRDAAARVVRDQLDALYQKSQNASSPSSNRDNYQAYLQHQKNQRSSYNQTQPRASTDSPPTNPSSQEYLQRYHTEWQEYYQKYYEQYYVGHLNKALRSNEATSSTNTSPEDENVRKDIIINNVRNQIQRKATDKFKKVRKSRHFVPIMSGVVAVLLISFLQYNQLIIGTVQAYVSPGAIDPQNIVIDPNEDSRIGPDPKLIIPKINVDVPVIYSVGSDHDSQMAAMQKGVAHFAIPGAESVPGQIGNTVLSGHSSNDLFDPGDYKFIFVQLDKLNQGDTIFVNYNSVRYTYTVTKKEVVLPNQVDKLTYETDKPVLTLITCTPIGTAQKRLLVTAEQVAPSISVARPTNSNNTENNSVMSGNTPTIFERLFGIR